MTEREAVPEREFKPYVPAHVTMPEFTLRAVVMGALLGVIFGASSLYLVLKVGLTVSPFSCEATIVTKSFPANSCQKWSRKFFIALLMLPW